MTQPELQRGKVIHTARHNMSGPYRRWEWRPLRRLRRWCWEHVGLDSVDLMVIALMATYFAVGCVVTRWVLNW